MIKSYDRPRVKDHYFIKTGRSNRKPGDPDPGICSICGQPLVILHDFNTLGHLGVCNTDECPAHAQPQKYLKYSRFRTEIDQITEAAGNVPGCSGRKQRAKNIEH